MSSAACPVLCYQGCYRLTAGGATYYALRDEEGGAYVLHPALPNGLIDLTTELGLSATLEGLQALADAHADAHPRTTLHPISAS